MHESLKLDVSRSILRVIHQKHKINFLLLGDDEIVN